MSVKDIFYPVREPSESDMARTRKLLIAEGACSAVILNAYSGNFLTGYLTMLGATTSQIALISVIPELGCVMQLFTFLFFEKRTYRKLYIILMCFGFRFSLGFTLFAPIFFPSFHMSLSYLIVVYTLAYMFGGFVTPAINQWVLGIAPESGRGRFFATKDIVANTVNAFISIGLGRILDIQTENGNMIYGFAFIYGFCMVGAIIDGALLIGMNEKPSEIPQKTNLADILIPVKDKNFRSLLIFEIIEVSINMLARSFLMSYQLNVLGLSHTFITSIGIPSTICSMTGLWFWGKLADKKGWKYVVVKIKLIDFLVYFCWFAFPQNIAPLSYAAIIVVAAFGSALSFTCRMNLRYEHSPHELRITYLGVSSALASLIGYLTTIAGSNAQRILSEVWGQGKSITFIFGIVAILQIFSSFFASRFLPDSKKSK